jgi:hypothetical protein
MDSGSYLCACAQGDVNVAAAKRELRSHSLARCAHRCGLGVALRLVGTPFFLQLRKYMLDDYMGNEIPPEKWTRERVWSTIWRKSK